MFKTFSDQLIIESAQCEYERNAAWDYQIDNVNLIVVEGKTLYQIVTYKLTNLFKAKYA